MTATVTYPTIEMCPDASVNWDVIPVADGILYLAPNATQHATYLLELVGSGQELGCPHEPLGKGGFGTVNRYGDVAIKTMHTSGSGDGCIGLDAMRANVSLGEGLKKTGQRRHGYSFRTPDYYGMVWRQNGPPIWAMSAEKHGNRNIPEKLSWGVRRTVYEAALQAVGIVPDVVTLDDSNSGNFLVHPWRDVPVARQFGEVVKLDVMAHSDFWTNSVRCARESRLRLT